MTQEIDSMVSVQLRACKDRRVFMILSEQLTDHNKQLMEEKKRGMYAEFTIYGCCCAMDFKFR